MILLLIVSLFSHNPNSEPVAKMARRTVYKEEIPVNTTLDAYLKRLVFFEIAKEKGYDDSVRATVEQEFEDRLVRELYLRITKGSEPNLAEPFILYRTLGKEVKAQLIQTDDFATVYQAWVEVMKGRDFGEVSEEYSTVVSLKNQKGDIGWLTWRYNAPPTVRKAFKMKEGEISFPFKAINGWSVIKVLEIKDKELQGYSQMKGGLSNQIKQAKTGAIANAHIDYVKWVLDVQVDPIGLSLLASRIPQSEGKTMGGGRPEFKLEDLDKVLARSVLGSYTVKDLSNDIRRIQRLPQFTNRQQATNFIEWRVVYDFLGFEAKRMGFHRKPIIHKDFEDALVRATISRWKAYEIQPFIRPTEDEKKQYFEENKEKYRVPEKRKVYVVEVETREEAEEIRRELLRGENFEKLAKEKSIGQGNKEGGLLGYVAEGMRSAIGEEAFKLSVGRISEPVKTSKGWSIIKVTDIKESEIPGYITVSYRVNSDYEIGKRAEIENRMFEENKERFGVIILEAE